jgi:hypothetical protein
MLAVQPPETDLIVPLPEPGELWDPHTIHTHYFAFCLPDSQMAVFTYIRYQPAFPLCQAGVLVYRGLENRYLADSLFHDYQITLPWPQVDGNAITSANGLTYDFVEPGRRAQLRFHSADGATSFEIDAVAVTDLAGRGHVMPGEEHHFVEASGGSEQFMRYSGRLVVGGEEFDVDCFYARDRSWRQLRAESRDAPPGPPVSWTPVYFDQSLAFNQVGIEDPAADPPWAGGYEIAADAPTHHYAWVSRNGELREIVDVRRRVTKTHPLTHAPLNMEIQATDETGEEYELSGEGIAFCPLPTWPNLCAYETLMRWRTSEGKVGYGPCQSVWNQHAQHVLNRAAARAMA